MRLNKTYLNANSGLPFGNDWKGEANDVDAELEHFVGHRGSEFRVVQQHGTNRVSRIVAEHREAEGRHFRSATITELGLGNVFF